MEKNKSHGRVYFFRKMARVVLLLVCGMIIVGCSKGSNENFLLKGIVTEIADENIVVEGKFSKDLEDDIYIVNLKSKDLIEGLQVDDSVEIETTGQMTLSIPAQVVARSIKVIK